MFDANLLPFDLLPPILARLSNRKDLHACALSSLHHPATTLKEKPNLAQYVRHVTETGAVHRGLLLRYPTITEDTLAALSLCTNIYSMTWIDDTATTGTVLLRFLWVLRNLPLRSLTIRTHSDLGEDVWQELITLQGLEKLSIWCMEGPPRVLQGWSNTLGKTLTHLELGVSGFNLHTIPELLSHLPRLTDLRLKGAPANSIHTIVTFLPNLKSLDVEYLGGSSNVSSFRRTQSLPVHGQSAHKTRPLPALRSLIIRSTSVDGLGTQKIWSWIRDLVPRPGLEFFKLHAFTIYNGSYNLPVGFSNVVPHGSSGTSRMMSYVESLRGQATIPRMFILDLALVHKDTLRTFEVGEAGVMTMGDVECLCGVFPKLEVLACAVASKNVDDLKHAIRNAKNLKSLKLQIHWIPDEPGTNYSWRPPVFSVKDARDLMLRNEESLLRVVGVGPVLYIGKWVVPGPTLEVLENVAEDKWHT
ncbi:hypothetical protein VNI00_004130 [Paramarasmius palmivorus]|uniref:F-box domain-containing protein n=1 Tax=Paramarasmius palmivorus TaxID=297713 RepID=A0AAW0DK16_9AGAR